MVLAILASWPLYPSSRYCLGKKHEPCAVELAVGAAVLTGTKLAGNRVLISCLPSVFVVHPETLKSGFSF
jgi:hypothetical protein